MIKKLLTFGACILMLSSVYGQRNCGSMEYLEQQIKENPKRANYLQQIEDYTRNYLANPENRNAAVVTIPVVVHVVYGNATENISDAQINSQMQVLTDDFRRLNSDADGTWSQAADTEIEFCLASVDPNGNSTNGITRTSTSVSSFSANDNMKFNSSGGKDAWPAGDYMNMWVCDLSGTLLGYAQFPGGPANTDGVVIDYQYFGTIGTATSPFDLGRTATHEVGHWLNLRHIWGDGGCGVDDFVADTPTSDASNGGCATGHVSCGTTDMVQNYMDYSDDACMNLYTAGQRDRMQALFGSGGSRVSLLSSNGCGSGSGPTCSDGIQNGDENGVDCGGSICPPCGGACADAEVTISITLDNYPGETTWSLSYAGGGVIASGGPYSSAGSTVTVTECLVDGCYDFVINDSYGDGICCSYGNGSYTVSSSGTTYASGGAFGSSETTNFCIGGGPAPTCNDGIQNGNETGVDCGGPDCPACPTCNDGTQNGSETGVDCGGPDCPACPTCNDGIQNGDETGVDCGGPDCAACPTCNDGTQNGSETGVDCGGPDCAACPTCNDGIQNGDETGVDCGGSCSPCSGSCTDTEVTISITFDNYPGETTWSLSYAGGGVIASGGPYSSAGGTVNVTECLADGCYDFVINDSYGDGICCSYGNGSYTVSGGGTTYASGGAFGSSEATNFCIGGSPAPTCNDGIQNGDETGIDCGGSCTPCGGGGTTELLGSYFESGWDGWSDGGSDCDRYSGTRSWEGSYSIRIRDNSGTASAMTSPALNLAGYSAVEVTFYFYAYSMENGEDFWLRYYDGSGWQTVASYARGTDFNNNTFYSATVTLNSSSSNLVNGGQFSFQCDASGNNDHIYVDEVIVTGISGAKLINGGSSIEAISSNNEIDFVDLNINPNPVNYDLHIQAFEPMKNMKIYSATGQLVLDKNMADELSTTINVQDLKSGVYIISVETEDETLTKRFVKN